MAKRKKANRWDEVFDRIRCVWYPDRVYPLTTSTVELDAVEARLSFKFPLSYRAFAERFGLGGQLQVFPYFINVSILRLAEPFNHTAGKSQWAVEWGSVVGRTTGTRERCGQPDALPLLSRRGRPRPSPLCGGQREIPRGARPTTEFANLVAFAGDDDEGLGTFLFQPAEVTDARGHEYRIFALNSAGALRPVADSFWKFLEWVARSYRFPDPQEEREPEAFLPVSKPNPARAVMQYKRDTIREKSPPISPNVKQWLAFNTHTVRDLALSIRDEKRSDAFPILGDALEEAGCTNADMLESCRRGDPDIDGVWVLRVLLGK